MPKYYKRRYAYKAKRSTERIIRAGEVLINTSDTITGYVWTATVPGTVSQMKLDTGVESDIAGISYPYALVYVPEGYNANALNFPALTDDLYNPTKNVFISGVINNSQSEDHKYTRYSRKVVPGDRIALPIVTGKLRAFAL